MEQVVVTSPPALQQMVSETVEAAVTKAVARLAPSSNPPKEWLTNREAMDFLDLSKSTLQRYRDEGILPFSKIGGNIFYRREDILAVLEQHRIKTNK